MLQELVNDQVTVRLKWGETEYHGTLVSVDSYMNIQLSEAMEVIAGEEKGTLGNILIRYVAGIVSFSVWSQMLTVYGLVDATTSYGYPRAMRRRMEIRRWRHEVRSNIRGPAPSEVSSQTAIVVALRSNSPCGRASRDRVLSKRALHRRGDGGLSQAMSRDRSHSSVRHASTIGYSPLHLYE